MGLFVAPAATTLLVALPFLHSYVRFVPVAATLKAANCPTFTVTARGCAVIAGAIVKIPLSPHIQALAILSVNFEGSC